jgi:hypothetical protein
LFRSACNDAAKDLVSDSLIHTDQERRILEEVKAANLKLDELRNAVTDSLGWGKKQIATSEQCSQLSLDSRDNKKLEDKPENQMSSMVKRVVEATGHGLEGLLEAKPVRKAHSPTHIWTTTSHALRPISWYVFCEA